MCTPYGVCRPGWELFATQPNQKTVQSFMKNKINDLLVFSVLIFTSVYFLVPNITFATSGACSSHGGVNCSLSNSYKSVVCNDGNSDGLTSYSDLQECKTTTTCDNGQVIAFSASRGLSGSSFGQSAYSNCESINNTQISNSITNPPVTPTTTYVPGNTSVISNWDDLNVNIEMGKYCKDKYGFNSKYNFAKNVCECKDGFLFDSNKMCVPSKEVIKTLFQKYLATNLDKMPEYKDVIDVDTIVNMAYESKNYNKTFKQLIVEAYSDKIKIIEKVIPEDNTNKVITLTSNKNDTYQKSLPSKFISTEPTPTTSSESLKIVSNIPEVQLEPEVKKTSFLSVITNKTVNGLQNLFTSFRNIFTHKNLGR